MAVSTKIFILVFALWALYYFARQLGLGRGINIRDGDHARQIAQDELIGFIGKQVLIDCDGQSALVRGCADSGAVNYAYIRKHGAHFVVHLMGGNFIVKIDDKQMLLRHRDLPKGKAMLQIANPVEPSQLAQPWASDYPISEKC